MITINYDYDHKTLEDSLWIQILLEIWPAQHLPTSPSNFIIWGFTPKKMVYKGKSQSKMDDDWGYHPMTEETPPYFSQLASQDHAQFSQPFQVPWTLNGAVE